jgi:single-strand DNA-binding protein
MNQTQTNYRLPEQNNVVMVGRLTRDPELRRTNSAKAVCSFDIAMSRRFKDSVTGEWKDADPTFVPIVVWGDQAERCGERLKKGSPVHIEGRLQTSKWTAADGTNKSRLEVVASRVQFLSAVNRQELPPAEVKSGDEYSAPSQTSDDTEDEDIPF